MRKILLLITFLIPGLIFSGGVEEVVEVFTEVGDVVTDIVTDVVAFSNVSITADDEIFDDHTYIRASVKCDWIGNWELALEDENGSEVKTTGEQWVGFSGKTLSAVAKVEVSGTFYLRLYAYPFGQRDEQLEGIFQHKVTITKDSLPPHIDFSATDFNNQSSSDYIHIVNEDVYINIASNTQNSIVFPFIDDGVYDNETDIESFILEKRNYNNGLLGSNDVSYSNSAFNYTHSLSHMYNRTDSSTGLEKLKFVAEDSYGHTASVERTIIPDIVAPINTDDYIVSYTLDDVSDEYGCSIVFNNISDNIGGSGIDFSKTEVTFFYGDDEQTVGSSNSDDYDPDDITEISESVIGSDGSDTTNSIELSNGQYDYESGEYSIVINNLYRDNSYSLQFKFSDNVSNESAPVTVDITATHKAKIDPAKSYIYLDGSIPKLNTTLDLGNYANHATKGIDTIYIGGVYNSGTSTVSNPIHTIVDLSSLDTDNFGIGYEYSFNNIALPSTTYTPHENFSFNIYTKHKNSSLGIEAANDQNFGYIPNKKLLGFDFTNPRKSDELIGLNINDDLIHYKFNNENNRDDSITSVDNINELISGLNPDLVYLKGNEVIFNSLDSENRNDISLTLSDSESVTYIDTGFEDGEEDTVEFYYHYNPGDQCYYLILYEKYQEGDTDIINRYIYNKKKYKIDNNVELTDASISLAKSDDEETFTEYGIPNSDNVYIKLNNIIDDPSGYSQVKFYNVSRSNFPDGVVNSHYSKEEMLTLIDSSSEVIALFEDGELSSDYVNFSFESVSEGTENYVYFTARVYDEVGNNTFLPINKRVVDRKAPDTIQGNDGIITVDSIISYSYSHSGDDEVISLSIPLGLSDTTISSPSLLYETIKEISFTDTPNYIITANVSYDNGVIEIPFTPETYIANDEVEIVITLEDDANNQTINTLKFYTPGKVLVSDLTTEVFNNKAYNTWQEDLGHHIEMSANSTHFESVNYYVEGVKVDSLNKNLDQHGVYTYIVKSVNGSGFESDKRTYSYEIEVDNYSPQITFITDDNISDENSILYFGPDLTAVESFKIHTLDRESDELRIAIDINEDGENDLSIPDSDDNLMVGGNDRTMTITPANLNATTVNSLENGQDYVIEAFVTDIWSSDNDPETVSVTQTFTFDNEGPELESSYADIEAGFSYIHGDFHINVIDNVSGIDSVMAKAVFDDSPAIDLIVTEGTKENYSHTIELIEGNYRLDVSAVDMVNNTRQLLTQSISVDHTAPSITSVLAGDNGVNVISNSNQLILPTPNSNFIIEWSDTYSKPSILEYAIKSGNTVVDSGSINIYGQTTDLDDTDFNISINNSSENIEENKDYVFNFNIKDSAGNESTTYTYSKNLRYDLNGPVITINDWNIYKNRGVNYINNKILVTPVVEVNDNVDKSVIDPTFSINDIEVSNGEELTIAEGEYSLDITAYDSSGHVSDPANIPFVYDITPPSNLGLSLVHDKEESYSGGETVLVNFSGTDAEFFYYQLFDHDTNKILTETYPNADEGWIKVSKASSQNYALLLPRDESVENQTVVIRLKAVDVANNYSGVELPGSFYIDNTNEFVQINIKPWIGLNAEVNARWHYYPGVNIEDDAGTDEEIVIDPDKVAGGYQYNLYKHNSLGVSELIEEGVTEDNFIDIGLTGEYSEEDQFYFTVKALLDSGRETALFRSVNNKVDLEVPEFSRIGRKEYSTAEDIIVDWVVEDNISITSIGATINYLRYDEQNNLQSFYTEKLELGSQETGKANLSYLFENEILHTDDRVYVTLAAEDIAGNVSEITSDLIIIDNSAPLDFVIHDQGSYINPGKDSFYFEWIWSQDDPNSPISEVYYQLVINGEIDNHNWISHNTLNKEVSITLTDEEKVSYNGKTAILAVKKVNMAGLSTIGFSDGIIIDNTAAKIQSALFSHRVNEEELDNLEYLTYYTNTRDLTLWINGYDTESGISKIVAEIGYYDLEKWTPFDGVTIEDTAPNGKLDITLPEVVGDDDRFRYKIWIYNGTGTVSEPFDTAAIVYEPAAPTITNLNGAYTHGSLNLSWDSHFSVPFDSGIVKIYNDSGELVHESSLSSNKSSYIYEEPEDSPLPEDDYYFELLLTDVAVSTTYAASGLFTKDITAPTLSFTDASTFVADDINFSISASESLANVSFKLGTVENSSAFTEDWIEGIGSGVNFNIEDYDLTQYDNLSTIDQTVLKLSIRAADLYGNWSELITALIYVDLSSPSTPLIMKERNILFFGEEKQLDDSYEYSSTSVNDIIVSSDDDLSGIKGYIYAVINNVEDDITRWSDVIPVENLDSEKISIDGYTFDNNEKIYVALRSINGADLFSETGFSEEITVDRAGPLGTVSTPDEVGVTVIGDNNISTYNNDGDIHINISSEISNIMYYEIAITDPYGNESYTNYGFISQDDDYTHTLESFVPHDTVYGEYNVTINLYDPGLNHEVINKTIRLNSPPISHMSETLYTNPLRPLDLDSFTWFSDTDDISSVTYRVSDGDSIVWEGVDNNVTELSLVLPHLDVRNSESIYSLEIRAFDDFNAETKVDIPLKIINTQEGSLYTDEYWSGEHNIKGEVTVPDGVTLTIADSTDVIINTYNLANYDHRLHIKPGASLIHEGNVNYLHNDPYGYWKGLYIEGSATLSNIYVEGAYRGVTLDTSEDILISNSTFENNVIGIHAFNANSLTINNSTFINNKFYGIKEEISLNPSVSYSSFSNNGYDYYDFVLTSINYETLNTIDNNTGNLEE